MLLVELALKVPNAVWQSYEGLMLNSCLLKWRVASPDKSPYSDPMLLFSTADKLLILLMRRDV